MNFLTLFLGIFFLAILLISAVWIGVYVVIPLILLFCVVSAVASLVRVFIPKSRSAPHHRVTKNTVIDVEFEEIK